MLLPKCLWLLIGYLLLVKSKAILGNPRSIRPHSFANIALMSTMGKASETIPGLSKSARLNLCDSCKF